MDSNTEQIFTALSSEGHKFETDEERQKLIDMFNHVSQHVINPETSETDFPIKIVKKLVAYLTENKFNLQALPGFVPIKQLETQVDRNDVATRYATQRQKELSRPIVADAKSHTDQRCARIKREDAAHKIGVKSAGNSAENFSKPFHNSTKQQPCRTSSDISEQEIQSESEKYSSELFATPRDHHWKMESQKNHCDQPLLIGTLTGNGSIKKHLYLTDASGRRLCHMLSPNPQLLNSIVLLVKWRYVHATPQKCAPFVGYIETLSDPVVLHQTQSCRQKRRKLRNTRSRTNISGTVLRVSSCLRRKTSHYMIEIVLEGSRYTVSKHMVIISEESFPSWASCIFKGSKVTIVNLKKAKIKADGNIVKPVLMATSESALNVDTTPFSNCISKQQVLEKFQTFCDAHSKILEPKSLPQDSAAQAVCPAYVGEITNIMSPELGIFALDHGRVILHCTYVACEDFDCGLREGSLIVVYDAHFYAEGSTVHLICCSRSNVHVAKYSELCVPWKPVCVLINSLVLSLMSEDCMRHPFCVMSLVDVAEKLAENFPFLTKEGLLLHKMHQANTNGAAFSILEKIIRRKSSEKLTRTKCMPNQDRFKEVLSSPHECIVQEVLKQPPLQFRLISIKELLQLALMKAENSDLMQKLSSRCWNHVVFRDTEIIPSGCESASWDDTLLLLGCLKSSKQNGNLQLADRTGAIDCRICKPAHLIQKRHLLCTKDTDSLIRVRSFVVVVESIMREQKTTIVMESNDLLSEADTEITEASERNRRFRVYLIFDADEVEVLKKPGGSSENVNMKLGCNNELPDAKVRCKIVDEESVTCKLTADEGDSKRQIKAKLKPTKIDTRQNMLETGSSKVNPQRGFSEVLAFICDIPPVQKTRSGQVFFIANVNTLQPIPENIAVKFVGDTVKWRPFLNAGSVIRMCIPEINISKNLIIIDARCSVGHTHEVSQETAASVEDACKHWKESYYGKCVTNVHSVGYALLSSLHPSQTMSIQGRIVNRFTFNENGLKSRLKVADLVCGQMISVYVHHQSDLSPNGLIPGAVVTFRKLNICVSKQGNVYGKMMPTTEVLVDSLQFLQSAIGELSGSDDQHAASIVSFTTAHEMHKKHEGLFPPVDAGGEVAGKDESILHTSGHASHTSSSIDVHNCSDIERAAEMQVPTAQIFSLYDTAANGGHTESRIVKLHVRPNRVLKVRITPDEDQSHLVGDLFKGCTFYAKCIAKDVSSRICLHFGAAAAEAFFRFMNMDESDIKEFVSICLNCNSQPVEYNCQNVGCADGTGTSSKYAKKEQSLASSALHLLCTNIGQTVMPIVSIIGRERPKPPRQKFSTGAIGVGHFEQNLVSTYNLKLLQFDCVDVI